LIRWGYNKDIKDKQGSKQNERGITKSSYTGWGRGKRGGGMGLLGQGVKGGKLAGAGWPREWEESPGARGGGETWEKRKELFVGANRGSQG